MPEPAVRSSLGLSTKEHTAEDLLDRLHCDLIIVKPKGFEAVLPHLRDAARTSSATER
jgi:hypothetical protein